MQHKKQLTTYSLNTIPFDLLVLEIVYHTHDPRTLGILMQVCKYIYNMQAAHQDTIGRFWQLRLKRDFLDFPIPSLQNQTATSLFLYKEAYRERDKKLGVDVNQIQFFNWIRRGDLEKIQLNLEPDDLSSNLSPEALFEICDKKGQTPLSLAYLFDQKAILRYFYQVGSSQENFEKVLEYFTLTKDDREKEYALFRIYWATACGLVDELEQLISQNPSLVNETSLHYQEYPICIAAKFGYLKIVKWLIIHAKASVNPLYDDETPALVFAAMNGHLEVVKCLVEHQANVNPQGCQSPIYYAAKNGDLEMVKYLLENSTYLDAEYSPPAIAAKNEHYRICKLLMYFYIYQNPLLSPTDKIDSMIGEVFEYKDQSILLTPEDMNHTNFHKRLAIITSWDQDKEILKSILREFKDKIDPDLYYFCTKFIFKSHLSNEDIRELEDDNYESERKRNRIM